MKYARVQGYAWKPQLIILIDSSTIPNEVTQYGPSTVVWGAWTIRLLNAMSDEEISPIVTGSRFYINNGPNKVFYEGVIDALECIQTYSASAELYILGDCQTVIKQLDGRHKSLKLHEYYERTIKIIKDLEERGWVIKFRYLGEQCKIYRRIDRFSKDLGRSIPKILFSTITSEDQAQIKKAISYQEI